MKQNPRIYLFYAPLTITTMIQMQPVHEHLETI